MSDFDLDALMKQAQGLQMQVQAAQQEIIDSTRVGEAGNGLVKITMTGNGTATAVEIDPSVVDPSDVETLQDLILGALRDGHQQIAKLAEEKMGPLAAVLEANNPFGLNL